MPEPRTQVVIVGAGPAGLTLAVELGRRGVAVRLLERHPAPRSGSRGCTIWQRTLEVFDLMGLPVAEFVGSGCSLQTRFYHFAGSAPLTSSLAEPGSPHPLPLVISQSDTEAMLRRAAAGHGVEVEWGCEVLSADQHGAGVRIGLSDGRQLLADWLVLAQGSRAGLRSQLGFGWQREEFAGTQLVQVDARTGGTLGVDTEQSHLFFTEAGTLGCLPLPDGRNRLFCGVRSDGAPARGNPSLAEVTALARELSGVPGLQLHDPRFAWRVPLYNAIADTFRRGRVLLVGDSAHTVVPVSAQGMNTGIQDCFNLGWKLADAVHTGDEAMLATYSAERRPVAEALLRRTQASYWGGVGSQPSRAEMLAGIGRTSRARSQIAPGYPNSPLSAAERAPSEPADPPLAGDRAPDAELTDPSGRPVRVFDLIRTGWTLLEFCDRPRPRPVPRWDRQPIEVHSIATASRAVHPGADGSTGLRDPDGLARSRYGFDRRRTGAVLIRPDGHVACRAESATDPAIAGHLRDISASR